jgi:uncharacterized protein YgfB (UPF0149 family)
MLSISAHFRYYCHFCAGALMKENTLPDYQELDAALNNTDLKLHPSQVHGLICGILCGNPNTNAAWEDIITGGKNTEQTHEILHTLYDASAKQLDEFLFDFQIVLPSDSEDLPLRAEALTLWAQGFLTGLKLAQVQLVDREPSEMTEAIHDLIEIAKMNYEDVVASEEDEAAYVELVEFVRVAVILIYQDIREQDPAAKSANSSNHLH